MEEEIDVNDGEELTYLCIHEVLNTYELSNLSPVWLVVVPSAKFCVRHSASLATNICTWSCNPHSLVQSLGSCTLRCIS